MELKTEYKINQAVILGAGERKCFDRPVGFLEIEDDTVIERLITLLNTNGIEKITIVTGYKKEYYEKLTMKKNLNLVYNEKFKWTGTMCSLALAQEYIDGDFVLVESDMVFEERAITYLLENENRNCMLVSNESGSGDEAFVEIRDERIFKISKDIHQLNKIDGEFIGISKISLDAYAKMLEDYKGNSNPYLNYEYVMLNIINEYNIAFVKIDGLVWSELDAQEQYNNLKYIIFPKLQRKEIQIRKQYIKEIVSEILNVDTKNIKKIEQLGGLTNKNYKVTINDKNVAVRIPGNGPAINRLDEKINSAIAYDAGLNCYAIYFNEDTGVKVCEFIENAETLNPATGKRENNMELMAGALRKLHACKNMFNNTFDPFVDTVYYETALINANGKLYDDYFEIKDKYMTLKKELEEMGMNYTPCHLDALPENFIKSGENEIYLIDWEFSGNYDKLWDVATICVECDFSEDEQELFFIKYFGKEPTQRERKKIEIHRIMQDMCWSMWSAAKVAKGDKYLAEYSLNRYSKAKVNIEKYLNRGVKNE